jgi:mRNA-degrading endonuclease RelE of RelBE toxin-antitoxin system
MARPLTVVELAPFVAADLWSDDDRASFVDWIARNPLAGAIIPGSGGLRKLRWAMSGRGKRGGARVIYYYHDDGMPLFLLTAYAKSARADLSADERRRCAALVDLIRREYGR